MKIYLVGFLLVSNIAWAQGEGEEDVFNAAFEFGPNIGNILPNQIEGVDEIHPQWGLWTGFGIGRAATIEISGTAGKGNGVDWTQLGVSARLDMPIEGLLGFVYIGGGATHFKGVDRPKKIFGGGHVGGGIMTDIGRSLYFRTDMKFNVNPGTSLYISAGFLFRYDGEDSPN